MFYITSTGCGDDPSYLQRLKEAAEGLGDAAYDGQLGVTTTHLIARSDVDPETGEPSKKYKAAVQHGLEIVRPEWVLESERAGRWLPAEDFRLGVACRGLVVALTGFQDMADRAAVEEDVKAAGGEFSRELSRGVTHLVAWALRGDKYRMAREWGIPVVTREWVRECKRTGVRQPAAHFAFPGEEERGWNHAEVAALPASDVLRSSELLNCLMAVSAFFSRW